MWRIKMKKIETEIRLKIKFYDSFFFGGGTGIGEVQSYLLRDMRGLPYISGAALKGCIAEYAEALSYIVPEFNNGEKLFGTGGVQQGSMYFGNGSLVSEEEYSGIQESFLGLRTGVSISRYTKTKKEGQLYTMEVSGAGGEMVFESSIYGFLEENTFQKDIAYLVAAVRLVYALGGKRSAGLGWLQSPIECKVFIAESREGESEQKLIKSEDINQWVNEWIGGK